ncbi:protein adenylyltransferase SelO [Flavobacterium luminosum]|uniref:Protein nucleotidyltransferase YdiU n=1 Tax=Flavobacterium luminosum TaxID=2949086 RepID=A0ABT0TS26_9FLAO|nr:YdiU family protein [Flavobacterium sp. HXWNR70]MCL9809879.1 YdiU family protein [Flavobacterium sp. HXWNR70]
MPFIPQNTFTQSLPGDPETSNEVRKVFGACYSFVTPTKPVNPTLIHTSKEVFQNIGLQYTKENKNHFTDLFSGAIILKNTQPYSMCYGGHQFGNWAGQLGDGRAINLFESNGYTVQLKGAGKTPYSRTADGLAVLRSSIREYLCAEAMHHLGVPTTRSLSLISSGNKVLRDVLYNGNPAYEQGAIVARVAPSFIRFGNFEIHASRNDIATLQQLTDYTISHHFPEIYSEGKQKYLDFFQKVVQSTLAMVLHWQRVGFVHGVMNTDNMSIHGITIDYGPYGWLEDFDPDWTPNTTDREYRRYRFGNQPEVALWNLYQLANALYPLLQESDGLQRILEQYPIDFERGYQQMMLRKLGLENTIENEDKFLTELTQNLKVTSTDFTIFFRLLSTIKKEDTSSIALDKISSSFYYPERITEAMKRQWLDWFSVYLNRLQNELLTDEERSKNMNQVNPKYVLRNYMAQLAIEEAEKGNYQLIDELFTLLQKPYDEQPDYERWFTKRPEWAKTKIGCSMLSCSS